MSLPDAFFERPVAHRALHDVANGRPENSREAIEVAMDHGYGIEIDIQPSQEGTPMVFHDYDLARLTGVQGAIAQRPETELTALTLLGGATGIPTLTEVLALVRGRVPLLIEIKDQDGAMGTGVGDLEREVARCLKGYAGRVALMSFNPHSVAAFEFLCPHRPRGLVTCGYHAVDWPILPFDVRRNLQSIPDFDRVGASFISHDRHDLQNPAVAALAERDVPIFTWTIRSAVEEAQARKVVDNITFEGYLA